MAHRQSSIRFETAQGFRDQWEITYDDMKRVKEVCKSDPISHLLPSVLSLNAQIFQQINQLIKVGSG